jgi:hypothetical protein
MIEKQYENNLRRPKFKSASLKIFNICRAAYPAPASLKKILSL